MKIQEFRDKIKTADRAALEKAASEIYKRLTKNQKEDLDPAIEQMLRGETPDKTVKPDKIPFEQLESEIQTFLSLVDANCYFEPNRLVSSAKRSKWRFEVMRFIKELDKVQANDEHAEAAAQFYLQLYNRLAYGCGYYIFRSDDPFGSIGIRQAEFYPRLAVKYFATGFTDQKILDMLRAATSVYIDRESLYQEFEAAFIRELRTRDMREKAYDIAKAEVYRLEAAKVSKKRSPRVQSDYDTDEKINEISITVLGLGIALYEENDALDFYMKHSAEREDEVKLYIALDMINFFGGSEQFWLNTYEAAIKKGVKPRGRLIEEYKKRKNQIH